MTVFRIPEAAAAYGALDDLAFQDGSPVSTHVLREQARNANRLTQRGSMMFRFVVHADPASETGAALSWVPGHWQHVIPVPAIMVPKPYGHRSMRVRLRAILDNGADIFFFVATEARPSPDGTNVADWLLCTGTGAVATYDITVPVRESEDEVLSFYVRAKLDPDVDALMNTGTYGTPNTGTVDRAGSDIDFVHDSAAWNTSGNQPHNGGHYVIFRDAGGRIVHGPAEIRDTYDANRLLFYPPAPSVYLLRGSEYELRKLPGLQVLSIACYSVDREP